MKDNFKTFEQFVSESYIQDNFNEDFLNEAFASAKLASLLTGANSMPKDLPRAFYNMAKVALDKIQDVDIIELSPEAAKREKRENAVYLYFTTNEKENPYAGRYAFTSQRKIPANTLLAITDGKNEWMNAERINKVRTLNITKRDDSAGFDKSSASSSYGTGISSMKQVVALADRAYCLDLDILRARYSTLDLRDKRVDAKRGAVAFISDKDFKKQNMQRYYQILAQKASKMPIDSVVLDAIEILTNQIKDGIRKGERDQYNNIIIGYMKNGRVIKLSDAQHEMKSLLNDYERYVDNIASHEKAGSTSSSSYYLEQSKQYAKSITDRVKKIKDMNYGW